MYIIRKTKNSTKITGGGVSSLLIPLGIMTGVMLISSIIALIKEIKHIPTDNYEGSPITGIIVGLIFLGVFISIYNSTSKYKKAKGFKKNGGGIIKKVKITSIERYHSNEQGQTFDGNYLQAIDGNMIYCSDVFEGATVTGTSNEQLRKIYIKYGFEYDKKYREQILNKINNKINESNYNMGEGTIKKVLGGVINNFISGMGFNTLETEKEIIEQGFQQQKLEMNGHTINVGDYIDIYIDPENQESYRMDIDFLLQK